MGAIWSLLLKIISLKKLGEDLLEIIRVIVDYAFNEGYRACVRIAKFVLVEVDELSDLTDEEKRIEAWGRIKDELGKEGRFVKDSVINRAIEEVLEYLKTIGELKR